MSGQAERPAGAVTTGDGDFAGAGINGDGPDAEAVLPILARLVGFGTVAGQSNLALIDWVETLLAGAGFRVSRILSQGDPGRAGLLARLDPPGAAAGGERGAGGLLLSAHSDVVPADGPGWSVPPFAMTRRGARVLGRGVTDMKGFLACALALAQRLGAGAPCPARPVMIALSWDEEIGCRGMAEMADRIIPALGRPDLAVVGEPTRMRAGIGHKGKISLRADCTGQAGHSALAPQFVNALHLAADVIGVLRAEQDRLAREGARDPMLSPAFSTVHAGVMRGGRALNIVPDHAEILFELRHLPGDDPDAILSRLAGAMPGGVGLRETGRYPAFAADPGDPALARAIAALDDPAPVKIAFGTEAGFLAARGIPTLVCGPGSMDEDGHQPDESIAIAELVACLRWLQRLATTGRD